MRIIKTGLAGLLMAACCTTVGCTRDAPPEVVAEAPQVSLANPAEVKCVEDGFEVVPQLENGVPVGSWCVDPVTKARCEAWAWFRGECSL